MAATYDMTPDPGGFPFVPGFTQTLLPYLAANMEKKLTVKIIAKEFAISHTSLQLLFRKKMNCTFHQYLEDIRMQKAFVLIQKGARLKHVIQQTGYQYRSTFNKAFKKKYGHPPSYYRESF